MAFSVTGEVASTISSISPDQIKKKYIQKNLADTDLFKTAFESYLLYMDLARVSQSFNVKYEERLKKCVYLFGENDKTIGFRFKEDDISQFSNVQFSP